MNESLLSRFRFCFWFVLTTAGGVVFFTRAPFGLVILLFACILGLGLAVVPLTLLILMMMRRHDTRRLCRICGYALEGDPVRCGACNMPVPPELRLSAVAVPMTGVSATP